MTALKWTVIFFYKGHDGPNYPQITFTLRGCRYQMRKNQLSLFLKLKEAGYDMASWTSALSSSHLCHRKGCLKPEHLTRELWKKSRKRRVQAHSRTDGSNLTPLPHRFWSFLAWRYPLGRNSEIQNFSALGPLGGVLWAFQNFAIFGYRQPLNGHNFWSTNDRKLVLVSNIMFWDELSEKNF